MTKISYNGCHYVKGFSFIFTNFSTCFSFVFIVNFLNWCFTTQSTKLFLIQMIFHVNVIKLDINSILFQEKKSILSLLKFTNSYSCCDELCCFSLNTHLSFLVCTLQYCDAYRIQYNKPGTAVYTFVVTSLLNVCNTYPQLFIYFVRFGLWYVCLSPFVSTAYNFR